MWGLKRAHMGNIRIRFSVGLMGSLLMCGPVMAQSQKIGDPPEFSNMRLVGFNDLQGRSAYQPTIHRQGDRWIAYIGHHGGTDAVPKPVNPLTGQPELSGNTAALTIDYVRGMNAYFDDLNRKGGIRGEKIKLISMDDGFDPDKTLENTKALIEQNVVALV